MKSIKRRTFLNRSVAATAALGLGTLSSTSQTFAGQSAAEPHRPNPIAVSTYSFWRFKKNLKLPIETCIDEAARMGFDGVDLLLIQMEREDNSYLQKIKRHALINGLDLCCMSTHQGYVSPDKARRQKNIDLTIKQIEIAYRLGVPIVRINTGRWGTTRSFDDLMANRGIEPILPGYTEDDGFKWVIDSIEKCLPIDSPWLEILLDTGNFLEDPYDKLEQCASKTVFMQAKTYYGGGLWYTLDLDYPRIARIMRKHNFRGYVSLEFEGNEDYKTAIPKSLARLRKAFS